MNTVALHTLGCKVNHYETDAIWQLFKKAGYHKVDFSDKADVYVINTCTVTNTGDRKSRQAIRRAIRRNPDAVVAVTGCYAQTSPDEILQIPGVDVVIGTQGRDKLLDHIEAHLKSREPVNAVRNIMKNREYEELDVPVYSERTRASLKIQEGCNNFCTFCIIPWSRGLMRSRKPENVLKQARQLVKAGYKEIVLTGIHTGGYGEDFADYQLADLLWDLDKVEGLKRIRISSIEASQIDERVLEVLRASDKMCRHLHVPIQSGDDTVLKRMRRKYTVQEYRDKVLKINEALPNLAVTTDVIVGFPGETEAMFENTYRLLEELQFAELHVFPYSMRTGTPAARMTDQVDEQVKQERVQRLIALSEKLSYQYASRFTNEVLEVIPEQPFKEDPEGGRYEGHSDNYLKLVFPANQALVGKLCKVRLDNPGAEYSTATFVRELESTSDAG